MAPDADIRHRYGGEKVAEVYFYIPAGRDAVDCGIKLGVVSADA